MKVEIIKTRTENHINNTLLISKLDLTKSANSQQKYFNYFVDKFQEQHLEVNSIVLEDCLIFDLRFLKHVNLLPVSQINITDAPLLNTLSGIEHFKSLKFLRVYRNQAIQYFEPIMQLQQLTHLELLYCRDDIDLRQFKRSQGIKSIRLNGTYDSSKEYFLPDENTWLFINTTSESMMAV